MTTLTLDGAAAIAWMRAKGTNIPGMCLNTVWQAYGSHPSIGPYAGRYPAAIDGWDHAALKHPGDQSPPAGVPCYFGPSTTRTDAAAPDGDVCISLGDGQLIGTDSPHLGAGRIGVFTIAERAAQTQRPYLGWCADFLGYTVTYTHPTTPATTPAQTLQEDDMAATAQMHYTRTSDNATVHMLFDTSSGFYVEWVESNASTIANGFSRTLSGPSTPGTQKMRDAIVAALTRVK